MGNTAQAIALIVDALPQNDQLLAYELVKKLALAWDPDFTKSTSIELKHMEEAEQSGYLNDDEIDWDNLDTLIFD